MIERGLDAFWSRPHKRSTLRRFFSMSSFLTPLLRKSELSYLLRNTRTGHEVASELLVAVDSETRRRGLLGRDSLAEGTALIIAPTNAVHTFFMRFPIDIAFVAKNGRVVKVTRDLPAWRMSAAFRAFAVIEMAAGSFTRSGTERGDLLEIVPRVIKTSS
jgi:uncharacterized protein